VLRFGGERALTKHVVDEGLAKLHIPLEDANKIMESNMKVLNNNALGVCSAGINPQMIVEPKIAPLKSRNRVNSLKSRLGRIMHKLYDLEPDNVPEKTLKVDFDVTLYQMEDF
jgi:hypothetical protein